MIREEEEVRYEHPKVWFVRNTVKTVEVKNRGDCGKERYRNGNARLSVAVIEMELSMEKERLKKKEIKDPDHYSCQELGLIQPTK
jgi:hypothetical protein